MKIPRRRRGHAIRSLVDGLRADASIDFIWFRGGGCRGGGGCCVDDGGGSGGSPIYDSVGCSWRGCCCVGCVKNPGGHADEGSWGGFAGIEVPGCGK